MLKLYREGVIKVIFGDGPFGFRVGETSTGATIVASFSQKPDKSYYPIYVSLCY